MAKVRLAGVVERISGKIGGEAMFRWQNGRQRLCKAPDMSHVKWSKAQKAHRRKFKEAVAYARSAMADPRVHAKYEKEAAKKGKRPFALAISDYFKDRDLFKSG